MRSLVIGAVACAACAACSQPGPGSGDAGPGVLDASSDGQVASPDALGADAAVAPDGPIGSITVKVYDVIGDLLEGAHVLVHAPDGTLRSMTATGVDGTATPVVVGGDTVTTAFIYQYDDRDHKLTSFVGVEPGDSLVVGRPRETNQVFATVTVNPPGPFAGADAYIATVGCWGFGWPWDGGSAPFQMSLVDFCHPDHTQVPVLLSASAGGARVAYAPFPSVPLSGSTGQVTATTWRTDLVPVTATVSNPPAGGTLYQRLGLFAGTGEQFWDTLPTTGTLNAPMDLGPGWALVRHAVLPGADRWHVRWGAVPVPGDQPLDAATDLLATFATTAQDLADVTRPITAWTLAADGDQQHDGVVVRVTGPADIGHVAWNLVSPPGVPSAQPPPLPDELAEYRLVGTPYSTDLILVESDADYAALREAPIAWDVANPDMVWKGLSAIPTHDGHARFTTTTIYP